MNTADARRKVKTGIVAAQKWLASIIDIRDAHAYGGLAMLGYGLHEIYSAAAWIACGLILFWLGVKR